MLSEAIFHIRSSIMLSVSEAPPQVIVVTSANPDEGKTTISIKFSHCHGQSGSEMSHHRLRPAKALAFIRSLLVARSNLV